MPATVETCAAPASLELSSFEGCELSACMVCWHSNVSCFRRLHVKLHDGHCLPCAGVANLVLSLIDIMSAGGGSGAGLKASSIRPKLTAFGIELEAASDQHPTDVRMYYGGTNAFHAHALPRIFDKFAGVHMTEGDLEVYLQLTNIAPTKKRKVCASTDARFFTAGPGAAADVAQLVAVASGSADADPHVVAEDVGQNLVISHSAEELALLVVRRDRDLDVARSTIDQLKKKLEKSSASRSDLCAVVAARDIEIAHLRSTLCLRQGRNVSKQGGYHLALMRALSHVGAAAATQMLGSGEERGELNSKQTMYVYEHRAAFAKHLRACACNADALVVLAHGGGDGAGARTRFSQHVAYCFIGDATNQNAIDSEKLYVSSLDSCWCTSNDVEGALRDGFVESSLLHVGEHFRVNDLAVVTAGTAAETYHFWQTAFARTGAVHWDAVDADAPGWCHYCIGVDAGPDNVGNRQRVLAALRHKPRATCTMVWCVMHQGHRANEDVLDAVEHSDWADQSGWPVKYVNGLSSLSVALTTPGMRRKLLDAVHRCIGSTDAVTAVCKRKIGKTIRGRWALIHDRVEGFLMGCFCYLLVLFLYLWPPRADVARAAGPRLNAEEVQQYRDHLKVQRRNAVYFAGSDSFKFAVATSHTVKTPIVRLMHFVEKEVGVQNKKVSAARKANAAYVGPTPMQLLIDGKAAALRADMSSLLDASSVNDPEVWGTHWSYVDDAMRPDANRFVVTVVLRGIHNFDLRFTSPFDEYPLKMLVLIASPACVNCVLRRAVAADLLEQDEAKLIAQASVARIPSDFHWKIKSECGFALRQAVRTGRCLPNLWVAISVWRAALPVTSQSIEGDNSVIQEMGRRARRLGVALASNRYSLKRGLPMTVAECLEFHSEVVEAMQSRDHSERFLVHQTVPPLPPLPKARVAYSTVAKIASGWERFCTAAGMLDKRAANIISTGCEMTADSPITTAATHFIVANSYKCKWHVATGTITTVGDIAEFDFDMPIRVKSLNDVFADGSVSLPMLHTKNQRPTTHLRISPCSFPFHDSFKAHIDLSKSVSVPVSFVSQKPRKPSAVAPDVLDDDEFDLVRELERQLDEESEDELDEHRDDGVEAAAEIDAGDDDDDEPALEALPLVDEGWHMRADDAGLRGRLGRVHRSCLDTMDSVDARVADDAARGVRSKGAISLVEFDNHADVDYVFIRWSDDTLSTGRPIRLDVEDRVIHNVAHAVAETDFSTSRIILHECGGIRMRLHRRERMHDWCLRARQRERLRSFGGPMVVGSTSASCAVCDIL